MPAAYSAELIISPGRARMGCPLKMNVDRRLGKGRQDRVIVNPGARS